MNIQKIRIKNFKSFYDETELEFAGTTGLWRISGQIGSGKTSIGEAIIFGLYGTISGKSNKELLAWGERHAVVELWLLSRGRSIYIKREINKHGQDPLYVEVEGEPIVFTNKRDAQMQLEQEYLDCSRSSMELLCIISFNNFKSLSTLNTKDTKLFLDQVLGLDILTKYVDVCKEMHKDASQECRDICTKEVYHEQQIRRLESMPEWEDCKEQIMELDQSINKLKKDITNAENKYNKKYEPLNKELQDKHNKLSGIKVLGAAKKKEIDFIKKGVCPTCGAPIDQSQLEEKEQERQLLLDQYNDLNNDISEITANIQELKEKMITYTDEKRTLVKSQENERIILNEKMNRAKVDLDEINRLKKELEEMEKLSLEISGKKLKLEMLQDIFTTTIRQKVIEAFVPSINIKIQEFAGMLNLPYVPEFDYAFKCSVRAGNQQIPTSSLSTGQLKMVDVVIILAILSSMVSKVHSNVIFMDELFSNLDPRTRADLMGVLRATMPKDSSVFVVSHQDIDTEMFDGQIRMNLERQGEYSKTQMCIVQTKGK